MLTPVGGTESGSRNVFNGCISQGKMTCRSVSGLLVESKKQTHDKVGLVVIYVKNGIGLPVESWMEDTGSPFLK